MSTPGSSAVTQGALNTAAGQINIASQNFHNYGPQITRPRSLRESLIFDEIKQRERAIEDAHEGTCEWVFSTAQYTQWMADPRLEWHHGLLWIKGNAGSGKSTMMKFMVEYAKASSEPNLILPHFFNARGNEIEQSLEGMYRTLLVWLLQELPKHAVEGIEKVYDPAQTGKWPDRWPVPELIRIFKSTVARLPPNQGVIFYIDALDECSEDEVREMLRVFQGLMKDSWRNQQRIRVCFTSRPHPDVNFHDAIFLDLRIQREQVNDITKYINDELNIGSGTIASSTREKLLKKTGCSFMWARLVVNILNKEYNRGGISMLESRLSEIPAGLHKLYRYTLERYPEDREAMLLCFRWVLFAKSLLTERQVWLAVQTALHRDKSGQHIDIDLQTRDDMKRYIVGISKGLIEVVNRTGSSYCQFIHESVPDFILNEAELRTLYGVEGRRDFEAQSHDLLKSWCVERLIPSSQRLAASIRASRSYSLEIPEGQKWPKLDDGGGDLWRDDLDSYAAKHMIIHAEAAQKNGADQKAFLDELPELLGPCFLSPTDLVKAFESVRVFRSVLSLLLDAECQMLITETQLESIRRARESRQAYGVTDSEAGWSSLGLALSRQRFKGSFFLLEAYLQLETRPPEVQRLLTSLSNYAMIHLKTSVVRKSNSLLKLAESHPMLSTFFLVVLTPSEILEPHVPNIKDCVYVDPDRHVGLFLRTLHYFVQHKLPSDAIDYFHPDTAKWVAGIQEFWICWRPTEYAHSKPVSQVCTEILEVLEAPQSSR